MTDSHFRISYAAIAAALVSSPAIAAGDPATIEQQLNALQHALVRQQEQLAQQQQAESFRYCIERTAATAALSDPSFDGFYVQASWILTGETRRYEVANGAFQAPRPFVPFSSAGGFGAWELALRFSRLDLDFHSGLAGTAATADAIRGGTQDVWTFGVNWYINTSVKLMFNWFHVDVDRLNPAGVGNLQPFGAAPGTPPVGVQVGQDLDIYGLRTQYSF